MVFCNTLMTLEYNDSSIVTILILIDGFLQYDIDDNTKEALSVTILILIDGFLQLIFITSPSS